MKLKNFKIIILLLAIVTGVLMTSGCGVLEELYKPDNPDEPHIIPMLNNSPELDKTNESQSDSNSGEKESTQTTTKKTTQTPTSTKKTTTTTPSTPEYCSHPSITTKYVGMDKATGKIIYDTYCTKCGEYLGRVLY